MGLDCHRDPLVDQWTKTGKVLHSPSNIATARIASSNDPGPLKQTKDSTGLGSPVPSKTVFAVLAFRLRTSLGMTGHLQVWSWNWPSRTCPQGIRLCTSLWDQLLVCWQEPLSFGKGHTGSPRPAFESTGHPAPCPLPSHCHPYRNCAHSYWLCAHVNYETALTILS